MLTSHIMTAAEKTFREVISLNLRVIIVLEEDGEIEMIERKKDTRKKINAMTSVCTHSSILC